MIAEHLWGGKSREAKTSELDHDWTVGFGPLVFLFEGVWRATNREFKTFASALVLASLFLFATDQLINDPDWNHNDPPGSKAALGFSKTVD